MATKDRVTIELYVDDQGTVKIRQARVETEQLGQAGKTAFGDSSMAAGEFASKLASTLGIYALITAGLWGIERAAVGAFKGGMKSVDDYRLATIGVAATITDIAKENQGDLKTVYDRNAAFAKEMYHKMEVEAARHFASAQDIFRAFQLAAQKGYVVKEDELNALGLVVDKIKLATAGQNQEIQIAQELRSIFDAQARATDQVSRMLQDRYGEAWKDIVKQHREANDLFSWLAGQWPGLAAATKEVENTLTSQKTTLEGHLHYVGREGLGEAYDWLVNRVKDLNDWLRVNEKLVAGDLRDAWNYIKPVVENILGMMQKMANLAREISLGLAESGRAAGRAGEFMARAHEGEWGEDKELNEIVAKMDRNKRLAEEAARYKRETYEIFLKDLGPAATKPPPGDLGTGGGGGADAAQRKIENIVNTLREQIARLSEGELGAVLGWANKQITEIERVGAAYAEYEEAKGLLAEATNLKIEKVQQDFSDWYSGHIHDDYAKLDAESEKLARKFAVLPQQILSSLPEDLASKIDLSKLKSWADQAQATIASVREQKVYELDLKNWQEITAWQKKYLDDLASASPLLSQQMPYKEQALELDLAMGRAALEKNIYEKELIDLKRIEQGLQPLLSEETKDQLRAYQGLVEQAKRFNLELEKMKTGGPGDWFQAWSIERQNKMQTQGYETFKSYMEGSERWLGETMGTTAVDVFFRRKTDLKKLWEDVLGGAIKEVFQHSARTLFDMGSSWLRPGRPGMQETGRGRGGDPYGLAEAGDSLQQAGIGFNLNAAQFGLAAGGLLLSGIGIMTNSQALVIAGTVLQVAGLAIQVYQALTATMQTTAAGALMGSAAALSTAASMLMMAAAADILPFHSGGLVAHSGLLVAHAGLGPDERLVKVLTGEPILQRSAFAAYQRLGLTFDDLNNGRLPAVPVPVAAEGRRGEAAGANHPYYDNRKITVSPTLVISQKITPKEADDLWRKILQPAYERQSGRHLRR